MPRLSQLEVARAALRLAADSKLVKIEDLVRVADRKKCILLRWAIQGRSGRHLDAILDRESGTWWSSVEALTRFLGDGERREAG